MRALLDTSFFVATELGRPLGEMAGVTETEVSVVTLAELTVGVLMADDDDRPDRVATLSAVESTWDPLPVDAEVARQFAPYRHRPACRPAPGPDPRRALGRHRHCRTDPGRHPRKRLRRHPRSRGDPGLITNRTDQGDQSRPRSQAQREREEWQSL